MAEGGSLKHSVRGSDAVYDYNCAECLRTKDTYTEAIFYCPDCHKYLCRQCFVCDHDVIGRRNVDKWGQPSKRAKFDPCQKHKGQLLELYCPKHDVVCCHVCSQSEHKSCGDPVYIPLVANAKENKSGLKKVKKGLGELHLKADKVSKDKTTKLNGLDQTEQRLVTGVKGFRARVDSLLDDMEKQSLDDIANFKTLFKDRYKSESDICDNIKTELKDLQKKLDSASTDESLLFSRIKQGTEQVRDKSHLLSDITRSESSDKAEFEPYIEIENLLKSLQGLGNMLTDSPVDKPHIPGSGKVKQSPSQGLVSQSVTAHKPYRTVSKTSFNVKTKQDKRTCHILGMCMMPSGHLILADNSNKSLKKVSSQYEVTARCSLPAVPRDVCHTEADQVAVALSGQTVQLVTVSGSMSCTRSFSTGHYCDSLVYSNKCLYITSGDTTVYVYNLAGTRLRVITQDQHGNQLFSYTHRITTSRGGERLHITDREDLVTMDTRYNLITRFTSDELDRGPWAVCTDVEGNVFVGGNSSNNVLQVGGEADKRLAELLSYSDGIDVYTLCFDGAHTRLLVASLNSDTVHVLHLSKSCGDSVYIPLVANAKENKAGLKKVKKGLGELHLKADKVSKDKASRLTGLDQTEQRLVTGVKQFRARVDALLDDMEKQSLGDIANFKTLFKDMYKSESDICDNIKTELNDLQNKLDSSSTDESLLFSRIKQGTEQVFDKSHLLSNITSSESSDKAEFNPYLEIETLLMSLQGLGKMLTYSPVDNPHIPGSGKAKQGHSQVQGSQSVTSNLPLRKVNKTSFNVKTKQDKSTCNIYSMCMMPSGHLILADWDNESLKKVSSQYEVTASCSLTAAPYDVCHTEADQVAVALRGQTVQLVTVSGSMSCTSSFSTDHGCNSLAYSNKCLYITSSLGTAMYVYNLAGTQLRVITHDQHGNQLFSSTRLITTSRGGERLHITDEKDLVTIDTRGSLITRFTSGELTSGPYAVCTDGEGNVFLGGNASKNVLQVGGEADKKLAQLLSDSDGIQVQALCFGGVHTRLLVAINWSDTVHVLHLSK